MFDLGWTELLLIGVVALIVVGPKDLPILFHKLGKMTNKARSMAREFTRALEDAARESGVDDVAKGLRDVGRPGSFVSTGLKEAVAGLNDEELAAEPEPEAAEAAPEKAKPGKAAVAKKAPAKTAPKTTKSTTAKAKSTKAAAAKTSKTATKTAAKKPAAAKAKAAGTKTTKPAAKKPAATRKAKPAAPAPDETKT